MTNRNVYTKMISPILTLSIGHISEEDAKLLDTEETFSVGKFEFGYFVLLTSITRNKKLQKYSKAFRELINIALQANCHYICLDRDAELHPDLQVFDW